MGDRGLRAGALPQITLEHDWLIKGRLAGGGHPGRLGDAASYLQALSLLGFNAILSLTPDALDKNLLAELGYNSLHLPISEMSPPTFEQADRAVEFIAGCLRDGLQVYVHCYAGYGRTGAVLAAYLVSTGVGPFAAIARVRRARPGSIESPEQERFVLDYARRLSKSRKTTEGPAESQPQAHDAGRDLSTGAG